MELLSRSEEIILLAIWRLQQDAYGLAIREEVSQASGKTWTIGSVYAPLHRLEKKGFVSSKKGEPEARRGGRSKVFYALTKPGMKALITVKEVHDAQWVGIASLSKSLLQSGKI